MAHPIDISGYNKVFRSFVTFAEGALHTEKGAKSIANAQILGGRTVSVAATNADKTGFSGGFHRTHTAEQANDFTSFVEDEIERELGFDKVIPVRAVMQNTGCTLSEAIAAYREKRTLPFAPYVTGYSFALNEYEVIHKLRIFVWCCIADTLPRLEKRLFGAA